MSERQIAEDLFAGHGYLSKNMVARATGLSLKDSGKLLSDLKSGPGVVPVYSLFRENQIKLQKDYVEGAVIYAISKESNLEDTYKIEFESRYKYYEKGFHYPPADSGIFLQVPRICMAAAVSSPGPTTKSIPLKNPVVNLPIKPIISKVKPTATTQKMISFNSISASINSIVKEQFEPKPAMEIDRQPVLKDPNQENFIEMDIDKDIKVRTETPLAMISKSQTLNKRKDTPFPKPAKKVQDFNEVISNKNVYNTEEEDEVVVEDDPKKIEIAEKLKTKGKVVRPEKKVKPMYANNAVNEQRKPIIVKRKVYKTRTYEENGKMVTEDYSTDEEIVIPPASVPIGKSQGKQTTLSIFNKV